MEIIVYMTEEQAQLLIENAYRNFPPDVEKTPQAILEFIINSTTNSDKRKKLQDKFDKKSNTELEAIFKDK